MNLTKQYHEKSSGRGSGCRTSSTLSSFVVSLGLHFFRRGGAVSKDFHWISQLRENTDFSVEIQLN